MGRSNSTIRGRMIVVMELRNMMRHLQALLAM